MFNLREFCRGRQLYHVSPEITVFEAARYMTERNVGAVCVLDGDRLAGILSERDLMKRVIAAGQDPKVVRVRDAMTAKPVVVDASEDHQSCLKVMKQANIRHLPVIDGDRLIGLISLRDLLQVDLDEKDEELRLMQDYIHYIPPSKPQV
ncbi:MAG TPA: CBS domain-containing protein [Candidatus Xenobia bacterium]|nr:CBS domain-containing protein [Candidatus Xenobia bacterium]